MSLNRTIQQGRIGQKLELQRTNFGTAVVNFAIAVERNYKDNDTGERGIDWIDVTVYGSQAEFVCKWFNVGDTMIVDGQIRVNKYTDKNGNSRRKTFILAESVYFSGQRRDKQHEEYQPQEDTEIDYDGELPFD